MPEELMHDLYGKFFLFVGGVLVLSFTWIIIEAKISKRFFRGFKKRTR